MVEREEPQGSHVRAERGGLDVRPFQPPDLLLLEPGAAQRAEMDAADPAWRGKGARILRDGPAWTGLRDGRVVGCAGLSRVWTGRAVAWCLLGADIPKPAWIAIHRAVAARLADAQARLFWRIEAESAAGWPPGERWMRMLGFEREGFARAFGPDGRDFTRWAKVR